MNKKGNIGLLLGFVIALAIILVLGFSAGIIIGIVQMGADEIIPEIEGIGSVDENTNITEYAQYTTVPLAGFIDSLQWMGGVTYFVGIIGLIALAISFRVTMNRVFIILFFVFALLILFLSIFMSNMYEDIYTTGDDLGDKLKEQVILSYLVLHSPLIFLGVIFISGIILFSGIQQEEFV